MFYGWPNCSMLVLWMANRGGLLMGEISIQLINIFQFSLVRFQFLQIS